jgi:shikimate dehydrogenase
MSEPEIDRRPLLCGLIGAGIQRSLTPAMQMAEARAQGLQLHYQRIDLDAAGVGPDALPTLLQAARIMGFAGLNITYPCKQQVIPLLDELSEQARAMGAVNTVVFREGRAIGHNTDGSGWAAGFKRALPQADMSRVVLLGAGGAGAAIAHAVLGLGAGQLTIVDREPEKAVELALSCGGRVHAAATIDEAMRGATGLIHATPTGMDKLPGLPLAERHVTAPLWVSEVVYFPLDTELVRLARARGCAVADGGGMAVGQAIGAFELFTGLKADAQRMETHLRSMLAQRALGEVATA